MKENIKVRKRKMERDHHQILKPSNESTYITYTTLETRLNLESWNFYFFPTCMRVLASSIG